MSSLIITTNVDTNTIEIVEQEINHKNIELFFTFDGVSLNYSSLNFGVNVLEEQTEIISKSYPISNGVYIETTQDFLEAFSLNVLPDTTYTFNFWVVHEGTLIKTSKQINTSLPVKVYNSWVWDNENKKWIAPMQYPSDGKSYDWDDQNQVWVER